MKKLIPLLLITYLSTNFYVLSQSILTVDSATSNMFIDPRDKQQYKYVIIGGKKWMAENLRFKTLKSLAYNNREKNAYLFGRLYNWNEAKCACPNQWRLPVEEDWKALEVFIGLNSDALDSVGWRGGSFGNLLKSKNNSWLSNIHASYSDIGFEAVPAGLAYQTNYFAYAGSGSYFWSATNYYSSFAWSRYLRFDKGEIFRNISMVGWYLSVRCVKDL